MDFAADAVFDVMAPPTRQPSARAPSPADGSEPSFDEHLDAAAADEEAPPTKETAKADDADTDCKTDADTAETTEAVTPPQSAPLPPAPATSPHIIQIVATAAPVTETAPAETDAPVDATAPTPPAAPTPAPQGAAPDANSETADATPAQAPAVAKSDASQKTAPDPAAKPDARVEQDSAAPQQVTPANAAPAQSAATQQDDMPAADAIDVAALPLTTAPQAAPPAPQPVRGAKVQSTRDGKALDVEVDAKPTAAAQSAPQPHQAVRASSNASDNNAAAFAPVTAEVPDTPAPPPQANGTAALTQTASHAQPSAAVDATAATRAAPAASQVAREIIRRFDGENTRFELRLDPPELGKIEVRLEVSRDNRVNAVIAADSPQALNDLSRHARDLEAALQSAGLELGDSGLSFDLRQGSEGSHETADAASGARGSAEVADAQQTTSAARPLGYERWRGVRVDVMV